MEESKQGSRRQQLTTAMTLMEEALSLLDQADDADSSSVHLDLAIERLRELISNSSLSDRTNPPNVN